MQGNSAVTHWMYNRFWFLQLFCNCYPHECSNCTCRAWQFLCNRDNAKTWLYIITSNIYTSSSCRKMFVKNKSKNEIINKVSHVWITFKAWPLYSVSFSRSTFWSILHWILVKLPKSLGFYFKINHKISIRNTLLHSKSNIFIAVFYSYYFTFLV